MKKQALGRGLSALIETEITTNGGSSINEVDIDLIFPNPDQPRKHFNEEALEELATSIRELGIISPITLRKMDDDTYQIIAGERRYRASKIAGLDKIPAYIKTAEDEHVMEMALIENIQREDLNAIEIALTYYRLMEEYQLTQERLSERVGKKRATIANYLRLLKLPAEIQMGLKDKKIDMGHARAIAGVELAEYQLEIYNRVIEEGLSVRKTEELVQSYSAEKTNKAEKTQRITSEEHELIKSGLIELLKVKVQLSYNENGAGKVVIPFSNDIEFTRLMKMFDQMKELN